MTVTAAAGPRLRLRSWLPWVALAVVLVVALAIGQRSHGPTSASDRAAAIEAEVRCPTCAGQSALVSDAPAAKAVRSFVAARVAAGDSDGRIKRQLEDRYGSDILLRPPASGVAGLVWFLPIAVLVIAAAGLILAFRRWRAASAAVPSPSDADRVRVAQARRRLR